MADAAAALTRAEIVALRAGHRMSYPIQRGTWGDHRPVCSCGYLGGLGGREKACPDAELLDRFLATLDAGCDCEARGVCYDRAHWPSEVQDARAERDANGACPDCGGGAGNHYPWCESL
jgi:hypothetical protein